MSDDTQAGPPVENSDKQEESWEAGNRIVKTWGIVAMLIYLIFISGVYLLALIWLWPSGNINSEVVSEPQILPLTNIALHDEIRLMLIVIVAGALGSQVHVLRSFFDYAGHRTLKWSWLIMYILKPGIGATLAILFYLVIRGGFFNTLAGAEETNIFGFAALAAIAGMFSDQAVLKLKEVTETVLLKPKPGKDALPENENKTAAVESTANDVTDEAETAATIEPDGAVTEGDTTGSVDESTIVGNEEAGENQQAG